MLKNFFTKDTTKILHGMSIAVFYKFFAVACSYALYFFLARMLGSEGFGLFSLASAIIVSAAFLGRFGLDYVLLRHSAICAAGAQTGLLRAWVFRASLLSGSMALLLTLLMIGAGQWLCDSVFSKEELFAPLLAMALGLVPQTLLFLQAETLKGSGHIRASQLLQGDGGGFFVFAAAFCFSLPLAAVYGVTGAALGFSLASWAGFCAGERTLHRLFAHAQREMPPSYSLLLRLGLPLFFASALSLVVAKAGIFFLGLWSSTAAVGIFVLAQKLSLLGANIQTACCTVMGPRITVLHSTGNTEDLADYYRQGTRLSFGIGAAVLCGMVVLASPLLGLLGTDFLQGENAFRILIAGELCSLALGPTSTALIASGFTREHCTAVGMAALTMLAAGLVFVPPWGLAGTAVAAGAGTLAQAVAQALFIKRRLGFFPFLFRIV